MKVTVRMAVVGMATAIMLVQTAGAAHSWTVWDTAYSDVLHTQGGPVAYSPGIGSDESAAFIEACRTTPQAPAAGPAFACRNTWRSVTVCSPLVGGGPIRRYADPSFWAVAGSPVQNLDFLFADATEDAAVSVLAEPAGEQRYIAHGGCEYNDLGARGGDAAAGPAYIAWASWNTGF